MAFIIENSVLRSVYCVNGEEIIYVPDNVDTIASRAFDCLTIKEVFIPDSVTLITKRAFINCNIQKISIPQHIDITGKISHCTPYPEIERRNPTTKTTVVEEIHDTPAKPPETDYKQLFLDAVYAKENADRDKIFDKIYDDDVKIPVAVYFFSEHESESAKKYILQNSKKIMHYLVENGDNEKLMLILQIVSNKGD